MNFDKKKKAVFISAFHSEGKKPCKNSFLSLMLKKNLFGTSIVSYIHKLQITDNSKRLFV